MKRLPFILLFSVFLCILAACRQSSDADARSVIGGQWVGSCLPIAGALPSIQVQYQFLNDRSVVRIQKYYRDAACQELAGEVRHRGDFALEVRNEINIFNIDMFFGEVHASAKTPEGVILWNSLKLCGIDDWTLDMERSVLGRPEAECLSFGSQRIEYRDVVEVANESKIIFGQTLSHLTARPDNVSPLLASQVFSFISY